jgi:predicted naringenin-chalcone synthase
MKLNAARTHHQTKISTHTGKRISPRRCGKKIVNLVEGLFSDLGKNIDDTKEVLRLYGNMSSATVLYVLERIMENQSKAGDKGVMLSFGPGFTAQRVLLEW